MHPAPVVPASRAGSSPTQTDAGELATAWRTIATLSHPATRHTVDATMENLHAAFVAGGIRATRIAALRGAIRKDLRQVWDDGIVLPLARSRAAADRALLRALPGAFAPADHAQVRDALLRAARWIPEDGASARAHVERALRFLDCLPAVLRASDELEALAFTVAPEARQAAALMADAGEASRAAQAASAGRRLRAALAKGLPPLVEAVADALYREALGASAGQRFRHAAAVLRALPAPGARRSDRDGPAWRRRLADALARDIVDAELGPALGRLLRRHRGLAVGPASYAAGEGLDGAVAITVTRTAVRLVLSARFDLRAGGIELSVAAVLPGGGAARVSDAAADTLLDASVPAELDTAAHRVMRRLTRGDDLPDLPLGLSGEGDLVVGGLAGRAPRPGFLERLVAIADAEGAGLRIAPADDAQLTAALAALGFAWAECRGQPFMSREPVGPAAAYRAG